MRREATLSDRLIQGLLRVAYLGMRCWWALRRPIHQGTFVMAWHDGRVLLIRNSYQPLWSAPGGSVDRGERAAAAASRELAEEVGLQVVASDLRQVAVVTHRFNSKLDTVTVFELHSDSELRPAINNREVVEARWFAPGEALRLPLVPHVRTYLSGLTAVRR